MRRLVRLVTMPAVAGLLLVAAAASGQSPSVPDASPAPGGSPATDATPTAPGSPAPGLIHHTVERLGMDVPVEWSIRANPVDMRFIHVLEFIGTAPTTGGCTTQGHTTRCGVDPALGPGMVTVIVQRVVGPPPRTDPMSRVEDLPAGSTVMDIDGVPAVLTREHDPASDTSTLTLSIPDPGSFHVNVTLRASVRGPGEEVLLRRVEDLFASIHFEPAVQPTLAMDATAAATAAARALERLGTTFDCFPAVPGTARDARVRRVPGHARLHRRLAVRCATDIEGTPLELWRMTLTTSWAAGPDHPAGSMVTTVWVGLDGEPGWTTGGGGDEPPGWP